MVFDRRFIAASPRYLDPPRTLNNKSDGLRPPLQDYCVLLTRSFLMVLGGSARWVSLPQCAPRHTTPRHGPTRPRTALIPAKMKARSER